MPPSEPQIPSLQTSPSFESEKFGSRFPSVRGLTALHTQISSNSVPHLMGIFLIGVGFILFSRTLEDTQGFDTTLFYLFMQLAPLVYGLFAQKVTYFAFWSFSNFIFCGTGNLNDLLTYGTGLKLAPLQIASMRESTICYLLVFQVYLFCRYLIRPRPTPLKSFYEISLPKKHLLAAAGFVFVHPFIESYIPNGLIHPLSLFRNFCLVICVSSSCPLSPRYKWFSLSLVFIASGLAFVWTGFLGPLGYTLSLYALSSVLQKKHQFIPTLIVGFGLFTLLQPIKAAYRGIIYNSGAGLDTLQRIDTLKVLSVEQYQFGNSDEAKSSILNRLDEDTLSRVMTFTPKFVPYWNGKTYETALFALIPRAIWPDKPRQDWGNTFGRLYRVLDEEDYRTSITCGYFPEGYINFGFAGLYTVAAVIGLLLIMMESASIILFRKNLASAYILGAIPFFGELSMGQLLNNLVAAILFMLLIQWYLNRERASVRRPFS